MAIVTGSARVRAHVLASSSAAALGLALAAAYSAPAFAQTEGEAASTDRVTITGSRIVRRDFEANSPIVTLESETFENVSTVAIESVLNQLPQFVPALSQFDTAETQNSATNTAGASTVNLRGLGANRNLVLLDGRRGQPTNASLVIDVNSIPSAAVQRVEIITGGASAVYGADAVGGVVNFILKKDFEGIEIDTQYGMTELGDSNEFRLSALMGANLADGRGNVMFGAEHSTRSEGRRDERDFYLEGWADPRSTANTSSRLSAFFYNPNNPVGQSNPPSQAAVNSVFAGTPGTVNRTSSFWLNDDNSLFTVSGPGVARYNGPLVNRDGVTFRKVDATGTLRENLIESYVSTPMERYSTFGRFNYELADNVEFFAQGNFTNVINRTRLFESPAVEGWGVLIPHGPDIYAPSLNTATGATVSSYLPGGAFGLNCPATGGCTNSQAFPVPSELAALLDSRALPNAPFALEGVMPELGYRRTINENTTYQVMAGFTGVLPFRDWTWEAYMSHGRTTILSKREGFLSVTNYRALVTQPNYGRNARVVGNTLINPDGWGGHELTCQTGLPVFDSFAVSQDCLDAVSADMKDVTTIDQNIAEANFQGGLFDLPAGEVRGALGFSYRENDFEYDADELAQVQNIADLPAGVFGTGSTSGFVSSGEIYGELLVPVLSDLPMIEQFDLELGYRYSDYDTVGGLSTYKILADWEINDYVRLRGGYNLATRAPNIGELYQGLSQTVLNTSLGDPCLANTNALYGNHASNPNRAQVIALCNALIGDPLSEYSQDPLNYEATSPIDASVLGNTLGNPNVREEEAKTWTVGAVLTSPFTSPLLANLSASVDYYSIKIEDTIGQLGYDSVYQQCVDATYNPTFDPEAEFCQLIQRDTGTGVAGPLTRDYRNLGMLETAGIDVQVNWSAEMADLGLDMIPGQLGITFLANYLDKYVVQELATSPAEDWAGTTGEGHQYEYRTFTTLTYRNDTFSVNLRHRYLPSLDHSSIVRNPATTTQGPGDYHIFDLSGRYSLTEVLELRAGIDNLFDRDPVITARSPTSSGTGTTNAEFYDVLGRRFYVGLKARF